MSVFWAWSPAVVQSSTSATYASIYVKPIAVKSIPQHNTSTSYRRFKPSHGYTVQLSCREILHILMTDDSTSNTPACQKTHCHNNLQGLHIYSPYWYAKSVYGTIFFFWIIVVNNLHGVVKFSFALTFCKKNKQKKQHVTPLALSAVHLIINCKLKDGITPLLYRLVCVVMVMF